MSKHHRNYKKIIVVIFFVLLISISVAYSVLREEINIQGKSSISVQEEKKDIVVTYTIENKWNSNGRYYYRISINILNNTDETINGWKITMKAPENVLLENYSNTNGTLINNILQFENLSYNSQILSKQSLKFEFQISTTNPNYNPSDITINGSDVSIPENPDIPEEIIRTANVILTQDGTWKADKYTYYQYTAIITNTGNTSINSWKFDLSFKGNVAIDQIWNAEYVLSGKVGTFNNSSYNGNISIDESVSFGFIFKATGGSNQTLQASNIILN